KAGGGNPCARKGKQREGGGARGGGPQAAPGKAACSCKALGGGPPLGDVGAGSARPHRKRSGLRDDGGRSAARRGSAAPHRPLRRTGFRVRPRGARPCSGGNLARGSGSRARLSASLPPAAQSFRRAVALLPPLPLRI